MGLSEDNTQPTRWVSPEVSALLVSTSTIAVSSAGTTRTTRRLTWGPAGRQTPSEEPLTPRVSYWRKSASRPSSPTRPSGSAPRAADQERQEDLCLCAPRRLPELHRGERRSAGGRLWQEGSCRG